VEAGLPPNPSISLMRVGGSAEIEVERRIVADVLALAALPMRSDIAAERFRPAQLRAAEETLRVASETRRAYYRAVAVRELVEFLAQAQWSAETASRLAARLGETGAMNKFDQAREQVFHAKLTAQLATARQRAASEREALIRQLGLWDGNLNFKLPNALPALPRHVRTLPAIEVEGVRRRVDLQIARMELDALAKSFGLRPHAPSVCWMRATPTKSPRTSRPMRSFAIAASISSCKSRCLISARSVSARRRPSTCAP
jgi:hypothetical protein